MGHSFATCNRVMRNRYPCNLFSAILASESAILEKKNRSTSSNWPVTYRFVAMGTLVAYTAFGATKVTLAQSPRTPTATTQSKLPVRPRRRAASTSRQVRSTPRSPRSKPLTHIHVSFVDDGIRSLASPGVHGLYTDEQALVRLLDDSGVSYRFTADESVMLRLAAASTSVNVTADATTIMSLSEIHEPLVDLPQTISVISAKVVAG